MTATDSISNTVVVSGASRGIGAAIAQRLVDDGWRVFNLDIKAPTEDSAMTWIETDLAQTQSIKDAVAQVTEHGPISGLVNNAGIPGDNDLLLDVTDKDLDNVYSINMRAPAILAREVGESMKGQNFGRMVNISSRALLGKTNRTSYSGTKGAIASMTRVWALELAQYGITCNAVAPGPIRTELFEKANPPDMPRTQQIIDAIPVGRIGEGDDIAHAVSFFMDKRSDFITGQVLYACGGTMLTRGGS